MHSTFFTIKTKQSYKNGLKFARVKSNILRGTVLVGQLAPPCRLQKTATFCLPDLYRWP